MPCRLEVQVPDTTKSSANTGAPMRSMPERNGLLSLVRPATTGSQNQGPNLPQNRTAQHSSQRGLSRKGDEDREGTERRKDRSGGGVGVVSVHLFSYSKVESNAENASGFISLFSRSLYRLHLNLSSWSTDITSVARPVSPTYSLSFTLKT